MLAELHALPAPVADTKSASQAQVCVCVALSPCSLSSLCWCASLTSLSRSLLLLLSLRCPPPPHILACTRIHTHRQVNAKRQQKKAEKIAKYSELLKALDEASGSARRVRN